MTNEQKQATEQLLAANMQRIRELKQSGITSGKEWDNLRLVNAQLIRELRKHNG